MSERIMKNFAIEYDGNTYWRSRSVAVAGFIFAYDHEICSWRVLANLRGKGCPNEVGKWSVPCGYLDFNEDGQMAIAREVREETGITLPFQIFQQNAIHFETERDQNVTIQYVAILNAIDMNITSKYSEPNEVDDIKWVSLEDLANYDWAFNHYNRIFEFAKLYKIV